MYIYIYIKRIYTFVNIEHNFVQTMKLKTQILEWLESKLDADVHGTNPRWWLCSMLRISAIQSQQVKR